MTTRLDNVTLSTEGENTDMRDLRAIARKYLGFVLLQQVEEARNADGRPTGECELDVWADGYRYALIQKRLGSHTLYVRRV